MFTIKTTGAPVAIGGVEIPGVHSEPVLVESLAEIAAIRGYLAINLNVLNQYIITEVAPKAIAPKVAAPEKPKAAPKEAPKASPKASAKTSKFFGKA
jgi:hypothetical protein